MPVFEETQKGVLLRVRLSPNSSSCKVNGVFQDVRGEGYLKVSVNSVPEKGKANNELLRFLSGKLKLAKSFIEIISGETDRMKKVLIRADLQIVVQWLEEVGII